MAEALKILAQAAPAGGVLAALYTVPGATQTVISSISICNTGAGQAKFRISLAIAGAADALSQYLHYDEVLPANKTFTKTVGISLAAPDVVRVQSDTGQVSFVAWGVEVT